MSGDVTTNDLVALEAEIAKLRAEVERLRKRPNVSPDLIESYRKRRAAGTRLRTENERSAKSFGNGTGSFRTPLNVIDATRIEIATARVIADVVAGVK